MTVGKFITGNFKFMANLMVVILVGMSSFFLWQALQPQPQAAPLISAPEGTHFLLNPEFLPGHEEGTIGRSAASIMRGAYFVDEEPTVPTGPDRESAIRRIDELISGVSSGELDWRPAIEEGLTFWAFDLSYDVRARTIYQNAQMDGINLWFGKWQPSGVENRWFGLGALYTQVPNVPNEVRRNYHDPHSDNPSVDSDGLPLGGYINHYDYNNTFIERSPDGADGVRYIEVNRPRPMLNDLRTGLVAPTLRFANLQDMLNTFEGWTEAGQWDPEHTNKVLAMWYLRIGSVVNSYFLARGSRMSGGGMGGGRVGAINLTGGMLMSSIRFDVFGMGYEKMVTVVTDVSVAAGRAMLTPLLTVADARLWGTYSLHGGAERAHAVRRQDFGLERWAGEDVDHTQHPLHTQIISIDGQQRRILRSDYNIWYSQSTDDLWYHADGTQNPASLSNSPFRGPTGDYFAISGGGEVPTIAGLFSQYENNRPELRRFLEEESRFWSESSAGRCVFGIDTNSGFDRRLASLWLCEFGLPGNLNMSDHVLDFRTIETVNIGYSTLIDHADEDSRCGGEEHMYFFAEITPFQGEAGGGHAMWDFITERGARSLASNIVGGLVEDGGGVDFLVYTDLAATITVWPNGLVRSWSTVENWDASILGTVIMSAEAESMNAFSYCIVDILFGQGALDGFGLELFLSEHAARFGGAWQWRA